MLARKALDADLIATPRKLMPAVGAAHAICMVGLQRHSDPGLRDGA